MKRFLVLVLVLSVLVVLWICWQGCRVEHSFAPIDPGTWELWDKSSRRGFAYRGKGIDNEPTAELLVTARSGTYALPLDLTAWERLEVRARMSNFEGTSCQVYGVQCAGLSALMLASGQPARCTYVDHPLGEEECPSPREPAVFQPGIFNAKVGDEEVGYVCMSSAGYESWVAVEDNLPPYGDRFTLSPADLTTQSGETITDCLCSVSEGPTSVDAFNYAATTALGGEVEAFFSEVEARPNCASELEDAEKEVAGLSREEALKLALEKLNRPDWLVEAGAALLAAPTKQKDTPPNRARFASVDPGTWEIMLPDDSDVGYVLRLDGGVLTLIGSKSDLPISSTVDLAWGPGRDLQVGPPEKEQLQCWFKDLVADPRAHDVKIIQEHLLDESVCPNRKASFWLDVGPWRVVKGDSDVEMLHVNSHSGNEAQELHVVSNDHSIPLRGGHGVEYRFVREMAANYGGDTWAACGDPQWKGIKDKFEERFDEGSTTSHVRRIDFAVKDWDQLDCPD